MAGRRRIPVDEGRAALRAWSASEDRSAVDRTTVATAVRHTIEERKSLLEDTRENVLHRIAELRDTLAVLDHKIEMYGDAVRVDDARTPGGQQAGHGALARSDPAGQPDPQHARTVATAGETVTDG